jgi:L-fuculose-phosphate aldolase
MYSEDLFRCQYLEMPPSWDTARPNPGLPTRPRTRVALPQQIDDMSETGNSNETEKAANTPDVSALSPRAELEAFFCSSVVEGVKEQICDIGSRMWQRGYVDGNGGNLVVRVGKDLAVCTPTLVSKGFMKPKDLCLVDFSGTQLAGERGRTSEILMHLQIMARQPRAVATVHCHPPYATAFGLTGTELPTRLVSEFELFVSAAIAPYRTPGTPELGRTIANLVDNHNTILMANHGAVAWSHNDVEDAYFKVEILETYCRTVLAAWQLNRPLSELSPLQVRELLKVKDSLGIPDRRHS